MPEEQEETNEMKEIEEVMEEGNKATKAIKIGKAPDIDEQYSGSNVYHKVNQ